MSARVAPFNYSELATFESVMLESLSNDKGDPDDNACKK